VTTKHCCHKSFMNIQRVEQIKRVSQILLYIGLITFFIGGLRRSVLAAPEVIVMGTPDSPLDISQITKAPCVKNTFVLSDETSLPQEVSGCVKRTSTVSTQTIDCIRRTEDAVTMMWAQELSLPPEPLTAIGTLQAFDTDWAVVAKGTNRISECAQGTLRNSNVVYTMYGKQSR